MEYSDELKILKYKILYKKSNWKEFVDKNNQKYFLIKMRVENNSWKRYYIHQVRYEDIDYLRKNKLELWKKYSMTLNVFENPKNYIADTVKYVKYINF